MKRFFYIEKDDQRLDFAFLEKLFDWLDTVEEDEEAEFYFSSNGGDASVSSFASKELSKKKGLVIHLVHVISSAAFDMIVKCSNKKIIDEYFICGMTHLSSSTISVSGLNDDVPNPDTIIFNDIKRVHIEEIEFAKKILTDRELKNYQDNYDVFLDRHRMKEIFDGQ